MNTLLLLRHAKSDWGDPALDDHDRPLNARGERAAKRIAAHLESEGVPLDLVLCSSARRTRQTLKRLRPCLRGSPTESVERELYLAGPSALLARLAELDESRAGVLLIGHNPGIAELAHALSGSGEPEALARMRQKFPTAALARLEIDAPWSSLRSGCGRLADFTTPRDLDDA